MIDKPDFEARALAIARRLFRIAYAILGNAHDCEDAVQQALERAWAGRARLREDAHFETWLVRILINTSKTMLKSRTRFPSVELSDALPAQPPPDPQLARAVDALPLSYRLPTIMHHLEGYTDGTPIHISQWSNRSSSWDQGRGTLTGLNLTLDGKTSPKSFEGQTSNGFMAEEMPTKPWIYTLVVDVYTTDLVPVACEDATMLSEAESVKYSRNRQLPIAQGQLSSIY